MPLTVEQLISTTMIEIGGVKFYARRMKPLTVINVARRLAPVLLVVRGGQGADAGAAPSEMSPSSPPVPSFSGTITKIGPMLEALGKLSDEDVNVVIGACLSTVQRHGSAQPFLWNPEAKMIADDSLTPGEVMSIVGNVLAKIFGDLMQDLPNLGLPGMQAE